ncbi:MAG: acetyl-CoA carboxylase biotin carboxyl carrier protein [Gemmatimonadetes bacterium]|nr:acetyl-CoA carboxylase biotin carboxyl carrier protein [Gemmatimonadota bacterium]
MNLDWLKQLIRLVEESDIDSLEVERLSTRVRIRKTPQGAAVPVATPSIAPAPAPAPQEAAAAPTPAAPAASAPATDGTVEITSPMVGTFYRAPSPDSPPFVSVGDRIEVGQTLCILEAMKLMNELESEVSGVIREISVENGEPVEFGALLFRIEPG